MDTLDKHEMKGHYLLMDNVVIHKVSDVQKLISDRVYKPTYLTPYLPLLNTIELFWIKVKSGLMRFFFFITTDNLIARAIESVRKIPVEDCKG